MVKNIREKCRLRPICTSQFRGWQIYVEAKLDSAVYRVYRINSQIIVPEWGI
jgi:hypothetical protein